MVSPVTSVVQQRVRESIEHVLQVFGADSCFAADVTKQLKVDRIELEGVEDDGDGGTKALKGAKATVVITTVVSEEMCNLAANMHGGCQSFLLDVCTSLAIMALRSEGSWETSGVTSSLTCNYFLAIPLGTTVKLVSTVLSKGMRVAVAEFRIESEDGSKLYSQGTHIKMDTSKPVAKMKM